MRYGVRDTGCGIRSAGYGAGYEEWCEGCRVGCRIRVVGWIREGILMKCGSPMSPCASVRCWCV